MTRIVLVAALLGVAAPSEVRAYRTAGDLPEYADTERVRWMDDVVTYSVHERMPPGVRLSEATRAAELAFRTWGDPECSAVSGQLAGTTDLFASSGDGRVTIEWIDDWADRGFSAGVPATTDVLFVRGETGWHIEEFDVYLDARGATWSATEPLAGDSHDVQAVLTHEVSHGLGLLHSCSLEGSDPGAPDCASDPSYAETTLYPAYTGIGQRDLSEDDVRAICFLYPPGGCTVQGCPEGMECTPDGCRASCGGTICGEGELCNEGRCTSACEGPTCAPELGDLGDPCEAAGECSAGICSTAGYCTFACRDGFCPDGFRCSAGECEPTTAVFGAVCAQASDCLSGLCLEGATRMPVCTRACGEAFVACPSAYRCGTVEGVRVCRPLAGCSAAGHGGGSCLVWMVLLAWVVSRRSPRRAS